MRSVSAAARPKLGEFTRAPLSLRQGGKLCLELGDLALHLLDRGGIGGFACGQRGSDLGIQPLLGLGDLLADGGGVSDGAAFLGRLGQSLQ
jgi:hypothetical protein